MSPRLGRFRIVLLSLAVCLMSVHGWAVSPEEKSAARDAATAGIHAFQKGDYDTALELLRKAEQIVHAPPHLIYIARAHAAKGEYVLSRETLMLLLNEELPADAPSAFRDAQVAGQALKAEIEPKIGRLSISVEGADRPVVVTVDGKVVPDAILGLPYPVDPGLRRVVAQSENAPTEEAAITVLEGQSHEVTLHVVPAPAPPPPPPEPPVAVAPIPTEEPKASPQATSPWVFVGFGTAAAGVLVGSIAGGISLAKTSDAKNEYCMGTTCDAAAGPALDEANAIANLANVAFALAAVGAGVGVYGLLSTPKSSQKPPSARVALPRGRLALSPLGVRADLAWRF